MAIMNWEELKGKSIKVIMTGAKCEEAIVEDIIYLNDTPYMLLNIDDGTFINTKNIISFKILGEIIKEEEDIELDSDLTDEEENDLMDETADDVYNK